MAQTETVPPLSPLEHCILETLSRCPDGRATIADVAQHIRVPEGTIRFGLQWLLSYRLVQYDADHCQLCTKADPA